MKYLLDTHALWQHAAEPDELSKKARSALRAASSSDISFLDISLYELARHFASGEIKTGKPQVVLNFLTESYDMIHTNAEIAWLSASMG